MKENEAKKKMKALSPTLSLSLITYSARFCIEHSSVSDFISAMSSLSSESRHSLISPPGCVLGKAALLLLSQKRRMLTNSRHFHGCEPASLSKSVTFYINLTLESCFSLNVFHQIHSASLKVVHCHTFDGILHLSLVM